MHGTTSLPVCRLLLLSRDVMEADGALVEGNNDGALVFYVSVVGLALACARVHRIAITKEEGARRRH